MLDSLQHYAKEFHMQPIDRPKPGFLRDRDERKEIARFCSLLTPIQHTLETYFKERGSKLEGFQGDPYDYLQQLLMKQRPEIIVAPKRLREIFRGDDRMLSNRLLNGIVAALEDWNANFPAATVELAALKEQAAKVASTAALER